jgi:hypothetical protein
MYRNLTATELICSRKSEACFGMRKRQRAGAVQNALRGMEAPSNAPASWSAAVFRRFTNALDRPQPHGHGFGVSVRGRLIIAAFAMRDKRRELIPGRSGQRVKRKIWLESEKG